MDTTSFYSLISLIILGFLAFNLLFKRRRRLPPSPPFALPIIGHLYLLKPPLHRTLHRLSQTLGPIISMKWGSRLVVVVSSPSLVEESFTKNDIVLANRPGFLIGKYIGYNYKTIPSAPYGDHWRNLRRLAAVEILSAARLNKFLFIRQDEIKRLLLDLCSGESRQGFAKVELKSKFSELSFNVIMRMISGKRYFGKEENGDEARQFRAIIREVASSAGTSNPGDFLPFLRWFDYKGFEKRFIKLGKQIDDFLQMLIDRQRMEEKEKSETMITRMLSLQEQDSDYYTDETIKGLIVALILAGTDTSSVTMEWAMSLLLNHPEAMKKASAELDSRGGTDRLVGEEDISELPYLQCIISETFRLCPAAPLLIPHQSTDDFQVGGYDIPRGTILLVNAWSIHRDPNIWAEPTSFRPERFENGPVEGHKLMPFGMGRRACPGAGLAQRVVGLALASLIQCFDWERISTEMIDLTEGPGLTMPKAQPLEALCKARPITQKILPAVS